MFEIGEYVVCGAKGVCQIRDITHIDMSGADKEKNLVKLGVPRWAAHKVANTGNRYAHMCHNGWIQKAISTRRLTSFGLVSMLDYYTERCVTC